MLLGVSGLLLLLLYNIYSYPISEDHSEAARMEAAIARLFVCPGSSERT